MENILDLARLSVAITLISLPCITIWAALSTIKKDKEGK